MNPIWIDPNIPCRKMGRRDQNVSHVILLTHGRGVRLPAEPYSFKLFLSNHRRRS